MASAKPPRQRRPAAAQVPPAVRAKFGGTPALDVVIGQTVALFHRLRVVAQQVHGQGEMSSGRWGILNGLGRAGPQTVPQMARARPVSRQYIQTLVNGLAAEGLVEFQDNPDHKRSPLVQLTSEGQDLLDQMNRRSAKLLRKLPITATEKDLQTAAAVLRAVREQFESKQWARLVNSHR